jgi:hypothetical protein
MKINCLLRVRKKKIVMAQNKTVIYLLSFAHRLMFWNVMSHLTSLRLNVKCFEHVLYCLYITTAHDFYHRLASPLSQ